MTWKMAQALKNVFDNSNDSQPILVLRSTSDRTAEERLIDSLLPPGKRSPVQKVQDWSNATALARRILEEVGARLDREMERTRGALEHMSEPRTDEAMPAFELTCQGLQEHFGALELLDAALAGEDGECLGEAVRLAQQADDTFDQAERAARGVMVA